MKTSNLIILATIALVVSLNIWIFAEIKSKFQELLENTTSINEMPNAKEIELDAFSHIVISDAIKLQVEIGSRNTISKNSELCSSRIVNDTLYISGNTNLSLKCKTIKSIELKDEARLNTNQLEAPYLFIKTFDNAKVTLRHASIRKLDIYSKNNSRIIMTQSQIDTANILASESSRVGLMGLLEVVRGELKDNSNLSVTGANNTQFSKTGNARINLN